MYSIKMRSDRLVEILKTLRAMPDEVKMQISKDGLSVKTVNAEHTLMLALMVDKSAFDELSGDSDIVMDTDKMRKLLGNISNKSDIVSIETRKTEEDNGKIIIRSGTIEVKLAIPSFEDIPLKLPDLDFPMTGEIPVEELFKAIKAATNVGDMLIFTIYEDNMIISSQGDCDRVEVTIDNSMITDRKIKDGSIPCTSTFGLDYMQVIADNLLSGKVKLGLGNDYPITADFDIMDGMGHVQMLVAPRIEEKD
jgi:proliferating cell nuclear antigen